MGTKAKILIVEGDTSAAEVLWNEFRLEGHQSLVAFSVEHALLVIAQACPEVILLRLKLPDASGLSLIDGVRNRGATGRLPIIVLGEEGAGEEECVRSLEKGADDYVRAPYGIRELFARIKVMLRPIEYREMPRRVSVDTLSMDFDARRAFMRTGPDPVDEVELKLVPVCYRLLRFFVENPYRVLSRKDIIDNVWFGKSLSGGIVDVYITQLREALKPLQNSLTIQTVRGVGFRLSKVAEAAAAEAYPADDTAGRTEALAAPRTPTSDGGDGAECRHRPVLISDIDAAKEKIRQLQSKLQRKTYENERLRDAIEAGKYALPPKHK